MGLLSKYMAGEISRSNYAEHDDFWYETAGQFSRSGVIVTPESAMRLSTVYACVRVLAETLASVPLNVFERQIPKGREKVEDHPLFPLLHGKPNRWQTSMEWREMKMGHLLLRGNAYSEIFTQGGKVSELVPLHPDRVKVEWLPSKRLRYTYMEPDGQERVIAQDDILHIRGLTLDGLTGLSPIEYERETIGNGLAALSFQGAVLKNDGQTPHVLTYPGKFKDKTRREEFRRQWHEFTTGPNRGKTPVLEDGMSIEKIGLTNRELQYIESRKFTREEIASIYRVPLVLLQAGDKTQTYSSAEQFFLSFVKFTMAPWYFRWEQALQRDLLTPLDVRIFIKFIIEGLLRGDTAARSAFYQEGLIDGWLTRNEVREMEDRNPLPGLDEPLSQLNMGSGSSTTGEGSQDGSEEEARLMNSVAKVVRKERVSVEEAYDNAESWEDFKTWLVRYYQNFRKYLREHLPISINDANAYIIESVDYIKSSKPLVFPPEWETERGAKLLSILQGDQI